MTLEFTVVKQGDLVLKVEAMRALGNLRQIYNRMTKRADVKWAMDNYA